MIGGCAPGPPLCAARVYNSHTRGVKGISGAAPPDPRCALRACTSDLGAQRPALRAAESTSG